MSGLRRQSAALPPRPSNLALSAQAYAAGDTDSGERLFHAAFLDISGLVRRTVIRYVDGVEDREDAFQRAMENIWKAVQRGREPAIELYAQGAAVDKFRSEDRHERHRHAGDVRTDFEGGAQGTEHDDQFIERERFMEDDHVDALLDEIEAARVADVLALHRPIWGEIVRALAAGLGQREAARHLGYPPGTVTRNVVEIRAFILQRRDAA